MANPDRYYSTNQVAAISNCSLRQCQHWSESGTVDVRKVGHTRQWSEINLRRAMVLAHFSVSGAKVMRTIGRLQDKVFLNRFLLFSCNSDRESSVHGFKLVAASNDKLEIIRIATQSAGVRLVELPL